VRQLAASAQVAALAGSSRQNRGQESVLFDPWSLSTSIEAWPLQTPGCPSRYLPLEGRHVCVAHYHYGSTVVILTPL
jgi:hypothetical protein